MDNVAEFRSKTFEDFCTASGIQLMYFVPYEHNQNGLVEAHIKKLQMSRPMGHKLIFTKKRDAQERVIRFKVRLVAQGFSQRPGIDFDSTYSLVWKPGHSDTYLDFQSSSYFKL